MTVRPIFFPSVPLMNPRTLGACQSVAFMISATVAPSLRFSSSRILSVLLPSRADLVFLLPLGAFFAGVAFLADLPFFGATWAPFGATRAFLAAFGCSLAADAGAVAASTINSVILISPLAVITAITTSITPVRRESKWILQKIAKGDGMAMTTAT